MERVAAVLAQNLMGNYFYDFCGSYKCIPIYFFRNGAVRRFDETRQTRLNTSSGELKLANLGGNR
ncbi:hypothetical protein MGMO_11c00500 [Methyloglobulus morosus KoM1]|uniref:Uncharacterized protein n=1 Tax=Methyloglobulus morosus KoM1 TaxID=1116472 RepID=V5CAA6_9GAMM|nr:hypothetical protein MGMO_11c00500 [Methyloglobulus morosus KoM1]